MTDKTEDKVSAVLIDLLLIVPCTVFTLWNRAEFELIYQISALVLLLTFLPHALSTLLRKVTMDYQTISIRNFPGITRTYNIWQITKVIELEHFIVLYVGEKKIAKIAKDSKNFSYLFERLYGRRRRYIESFSCFKVPGCFLLAENHRYSSL